MITVYNKEDKVIVLKSVNANPLRLLPGNNTVDMPDLSVYTDNNVAAKALVENSLSIVNQKGLNAKEQKAADDAKVKNDKLNKSAKLLKAAQDKLAKAQDKANSNGAENRALKKELDALKAQVAGLLKTKPVGRPKKV